MSLIGLIVSKVQNLYLQTFVFLIQVAVIKGKFHEERSNIAAYVRFTEKEMAVKATAFNGSVLEGHTIRVDLAAASR